MVLMGSAWGALCQLRYARNCGHDVDADRTDHGGRGAPVVDPAGRFRSTGRSPRREEPLRDGGEGSNERCDRRAQTGGAQRAAGFGPATSPPAQPINTTSV